MRTPPIVLAYHGIGTVPREGDPHNLFVPAERFVAQIERLRRRGYRFIPLVEFAAHLSEPQRLGGACALTFDDGSSDNATVLPELLSSLDAPATVFVCPGLLGQPNPSTDPSTGIRLMTRDELKYLAGLPLFDLGSHTNHHTVLANATKEEADYELTDSKQNLEAIIGRPVETFAYPRCLYSAVCPDAARRAGYSVAVACRKGKFTPFELRRETIDSLDNRLTFELKSRRLWEPIRGSSIGRGARALVRPLRHPGRATSPP